MNYKIRKATPEDLDEIIQLCQEHANYEQANYSAEGKKEKLADMLFNESPQLHCLLAESDKGIVGYTTFSKECSTWNAAYFTHMDCLFLRENFRGNGIGEALVEEIIKFSKVINSNHIEWQTPAFNVRAIKFYKRIGATEKEKFRFTLQIK